MLGLAVQQCDDWMDQLPKEIQVLYISILKCCHHGHVQGFSFVFQINKWQISLKKLKQNLINMIIYSLLLSVSPELLQSGQRQQWWWRRRRRWRLWDSSHHTTEPRRPISAAPHGARVWLPLPFPASQWPAQRLLLPWAAHTHDVQHAGSGLPPPLRAYALSEYTFFLSASILLQPLNSNRSQMLWWVISLQVREHFLLLPSCFIL